MIRLKINGFLKFNDFALRNKCVKWVEVSNKLTDMGVDSSSSLFQSHLLMASISKNNGQNRNGVVAKNIPCKQDIHRHEKCNSSNDTNAHVNQLAKQKHGIHYCTTNLKQTIVHNVIFDNERCQMKIFTDNCTPSKWKQLVKYRIMRILAVLKFC